jgi:DNA mismatch repair protein MutS
LPGGTDKSYGIHVARLAGVPKSVTHRSTEILRDLENTFAKEAEGPALTQNKTVDDAGYLLFVNKHKPVIDRLASTDVNNLTPMEAINLLSQIKAELD